MGASGALKAQHLLLPGQAFPWRFLHCMLNVSLTSAPLTRPARLPALPVPQKIRDAMLASLQVLRNGREQPFTQRELLRAKRTLLTRHESDLKVSGEKSSTVREPLAECQ